MAQTILEEKKKSRLMTEGSIWKSILLFSVPLIPVSYTHLTLPTT